MKMIQLQDYEMLENSVICVACEGMLCTNIDKMINEGHILTEYTDLPAHIISPITVKLTRDPYIEERCQKFFLNMGQIKVEVDDTSDKDVEESKELDEPIQLKNEEITIKTDDMDDE